MLFRSETAPATEVWPNFYGEAFLLDYRLFYMLRYARHRGLTNLVLNTNGTRISEDVAEWILDSGLRIIMFSLDGFTPETFQAIRCGANRDAVFANIERLLEGLSELAGTEPPGTDPRFPLVLSAGERRSFTANTIMRDPTWRKRGFSGELRISPSDAASLGLAGYGARTR